MREEMVPLFNKWGKVTIFSDHVLLLLFFVPSSLFPDFAHWPEVRLFVKSQSA